MSETKDSFGGTTDASGSVGNSPSEQVAGDAQQSPQHPEVTEGSKVKPEEKTIASSNDHTAERSREKQSEHDSVEDLSAEQLRQLALSDSPIVPEVATESEHVGSLTGELPVDQQGQVSVDGNVPEIVSETTDQSKLKEPLQQLPKVDDSSVPETTATGENYDQPLEISTAKHPQNNVLASVEEEVSDTLKEEPATMRPREESSALLEEAAAVPSKEVDATLLEEETMVRPKEVDATFLEEETVISPNKAAAASDIEDTAESSSEVAVEQPKDLATPTLPNKDTEAHPINEAAISPKDTSGTEKSAEQPQERSTNIGTISNDVETEITTPLLGDQGQKVQQEEQKPNLPPRQPKTPEGYRLKDIQWQDPLTGRQREVKIVTQNENGPCPLIALVNVLSLTGEISLGSASKRTTTDEELTGLLANHLLSRESGLPPADQVTMILSLLPTMNKGLDVDLQFSHIYDFAATPPVKLFRAFGVDLVHGWVVDPDSEPQIASLLLSECRNSYEGAVEFILSSDELSNGQVVNQSVVDLSHHNTPELSDTQQQTVYRAIALNEWLTATATQLTPCGLQLLTNRLPVGRLCMLFRNNHFSTIFKRTSDTLLLLCTDDVVAGDPRIVWESLCDVHQASSQFLDSKFQPLAVNTVTKGKLPEGDYARQGDTHRSRNGQEEDARQIDSDYAMALRLQEQEERTRRMRSEESPKHLQVRQQDRLPPGMAPNSQLYGVPEVTRAGETKLARAIYRTASDENFSRRMEDTLLPQSAAAKAQRKKEEQRLQQREKQRNDQDKCIIC
ncbi:hypothetical protein H4R24_001456 [Coemansia sp. RSA 988]|nr:hypothetical protein H4R24_001456 [Coemansia sp. RSA 988]